MDTFRWWPLEGGRHAIPGELEPNDEGHTLCGLPLTVLPRTFGKTEWLWPTCAACTEAATARVHVWRAGVHTWGWA